MSKNRATGFLAQARRRAADKRGGSGKDRYIRFCKQAEADRKAIEFCCEDILRYPTSLFKK